MENPPENMRARYRNLHPLLWARSVEKARSAGELFDILEEIPKRYPLIWDEATRRWIFTDDILQSGAYEQAEANRQED